MLYSFCNCINALWFVTCWQILNQGPQNNNNAISFNLERSALVIRLSVSALHHNFSRPSLVISDVFTTLVLVLLPVILCSWTGLRHAVCGPPGTLRGSDPVPLSLQWQFSPSLLPHKKKKRPGLATTTTSKKNSAEGFLWDKDCQCQLQYDKCQCYEDRHEQGWAGWPFPNVTCHQSFMSPSKQYVRGIKNHYTLELCYTGQK